MTLRHRVAENYCRRIGSLGWGGLLFGWIDPGRGWQPGRLRGIALEAFGVSQERDIEGLGALLEEGLCAAVMHALWGPKPDARVAVDGVVPVTFPQFRGHRVQPEPSSLRTRPGNSSRAWSDAAADCRTPQCTRRYPVSLRSEWRSADGTRARV